MSGRFVRASKYRHVFGRSTKKEQCYDNLRISKNAWDTNLVKVNPQYLSINWEAGGGGAFAVIPLHERGKFPDRIPLFRGHTAVVLDTDWCPFDDNFLASGSDDAKICLWKVPTDFTVRPNVSSADDIVDVAPTAKLTGHNRKVGHVLFNTAAKDVLASSSGDYTVKVWDLNEGAPKLTLKHSDVVQSLCWSGNGGLLVTTSRDKKLRVWDVRQEKPAMETQGHSGAKNSRAVWMGEHDRIATTGFSRMSDRQLGLWDVRAAREPLNGFEILDQISGVCMPFWDDGNDCLYLAGKGDGNIRYYEYQNDKFEYLSQYSSADPQRGVAFLPKRGVDTHENEITRAYKTINDTTIEPISFIVPRRAEVFQGDIYPPCVGTKPAMSAAEYFGGAEARPPPKISLETLYDGGGESEVPDDYKAPTQPPKENIQSSIPPVSSPLKNTAASPALETTSTAPTSMNDNKASMAAAAAKFQDNEEDDEDNVRPAKTNGASADDFDEVPQQPSRQGASSASVVSTTIPSSDESPGAAKSVITTPSTSMPLPASSSTATAADSSPHARSPSATEAMGGLKSRLADINALLESQGATIARQDARIDELMREVSALKSSGSSTTVGTESTTNSSEATPQRNTSTGLWQKS